ncbi:MAG: hypothetical protein IKY38_01185 [Anaerotignum sp.]|nr:hypothetical protein [Anaerotignum sp.]
MADWDYRPEEEPKEEKEKKYVTRKEFRFCFVILLAAIGFATFSINDSIRQSRNETSNAIYMMEERFNNRIDSIPRNIEQGIADANNPIDKGYAVMTDVDYDAKTATLSLSVVPKEYQEGMTVHFFVSCDGNEAMKVNAVAQEDRTFVAECDVPYCERAEVKAVMRKGNTEYLKYIGNESIYDRVYPQGHGMFPGSVSYGNGVHRFNRMVELQVSAPDWIAGKEEFALKNVTAVVEIDGKAVMIIPMVEREKYHYGAYYEVQLEEFKLREGEKLKVYCTAEDDGGRKYTCIVEQGEAMKNDYISQESAWDGNGWLIIE